MSYILPCIIKAYVFSILVSYSTQLKTSFLCIYNKTTIIINERIIYVANEKECDSKFKQTQYLIYH